MMTFNKNYWDQLYQKNQTGWDAGSITTPIKEYIDQLTDKSIKILVPGAGNAYEVEYLFKNGFKNCYLLDFSEEPIHNFIKRVPDFPISHIIKEDFFKHNNQYDLVIEHTFFSSIIPFQRSSFVSKIKELLKENGLYVGLLFNIDFKKNYPPFGGNIESYRQLFSKDFNIDVLEIAYNSIKPRRNNELFIKLSRK